MYKNTQRFIQFELWKTCSIGCKFCCNKGQKEVNKNISLDFTKSIINQLPENTYDEIGFIGGEFFNGEIKDSQIKDKFYDLFKCVKNKNFKKIYIATSLIFDMQSYLIPFLDYLQHLNILDKVILCTSFDVKYRFSTLDKKELWKNNMLYLKENYKNLRLHTEIILTEWFLKAILEKKFNLYNFSNVFNTSIDYIEPSSGLYYHDKFECEKACPGFFPHKKVFIEFIKKCLKENLINIDTFLSMELRSNTLYFFEDGNIKKAINRRSGDGRCELQDKTKKYDIGFIDSNKTMKQVADEIFKLYRGF